jgi:hypothetical protein
MEFRAGSLCEPRLAKEWYIVSFWEGRMKGFSTSFRVMGVGLALVATLLAQPPQDKTGCSQGPEFVPLRQPHFLPAALGQEVRYNSVSPEVYRGVGFPGADDLGNMFQFKRDFEEYFCGARRLDFARSLNPSLQDFKTWLARNKSAIPIAPGAASA